MVRLGQGALPLEGRWPHSAVVDPGNDTTSTVVGVDKTTTKGPLQWALGVEHSISLPKQHPLFIRVCGSCQVNRASLSYPVIERVNPRACICCLRVRSLLPLRSPCRPLTKGGGHPKRISKRVRPIHLVGLDLILRKPMGATIDPTVGRSPGIVFLIVILESYLYVLFSLNSG
jgi:hypothetical protein